MHRNASFIYTPGDKIIVGGYHYLCVPSTNQNDPPHKIPPFNGPKQVKCTTTKNVLESAMEAKLGALLVNYQWGTALRIFFKVMGHQQPPAPVFIDSATRNGFMNNNIQQQKYRAISMQFYWVWKRMRQGHNLVHFEIGKDNLADYFTKNDPTKHQCATRGTYLVPTSESSNHACYHIPNCLWGCVNHPPTPQPTQETG